MQNDATQSTIAFITRHSQKWTLLNNIFNHFGLSSHFKTCFEYTYLHDKKHGHKHDERFYRETDSTVQTRLGFPRGNRGSEKTRGCSGQQAGPNGGVKQISECVFC